MLLLQRLLHIKPPFEFFMIFLTDCRRLFVCQNLPATWAIRAGPMMLNKENAISFHRGQNLQNHTQLATMLPEVVGIKKQGWPYCTQ